LHKAIKLNGMMTRSGGESDKLGNRYEATWTVDRLLALACGELAAVTVEPFDADGLGVEFVAERSDGVREFHSVKRQRAKGEWTLSALARLGKNGRSILSDLFDKLKRDTSAHCCFISSTGANQLLELAERAKRCASATQFQRDIDSNAVLRSAFDKHVLTVAGDLQVAFDWISRCRAVLIDEKSLRDRVDQHLATLTYRPDGKPYESSDVRLLLAELVLDNLGTPLSSERVWEFLKSRGYAHRDWGRDTSLFDQIRNLNESYTRAVEIELINGARIERREASTAVDEIGKDDGARQVLLAAASGAGKSCAVAQIATILASRDIPHLVVRLDQHSDAHRAHDVGRQLGLPRSPTVVLAGVAAGGRSVLLIDQLDALSQASGRYPHLWDVFAELSREVEAYPNMRLVVACREFDLKNDHRLLKFSRQDHSLLTIPVAPLSIEQVEGALAAAGFDHKLFSRGQKELLQIPLHLLFFLESFNEGSAAFRSSSDLFDLYWERKQQAVSLQIGGSSEWPQVIDRMCAAMSERQALAVPKSVLDDWRETVSSMESHHVLVTQGGQVRFFHESFFDYAFSRRFCAAGQSLRELLLSSEQHLFRRGQVRQVLTYLRDHDRNAYLEQLAQLISDEHVRFHIKKLVFQWLGSSEDPTKEEWAILEVLFDNESLQHHALVPLRDSLPWFDLLNKLGTIRKWLEDLDDRVVNRGLWMLWFPQVRERRSDQVAILLAPFRMRSAAWSQRLRGLFRYGHAHQSREMQELFLHLLDDGTFDDGGDEQRRDIWDSLRDAVEPAPAFVVEAIAHWLDRQIKIAAEAGDDSILERRHYGQSVEHVILEAAKKEPALFAATILLRFCRIAELTICESTEGLQEDRTWSCRSNHTFGDAAAIQEGLVMALASLAMTSKSDFDRLTEPLNNSTLESVNYLLLRSWMANPVDYGGICIRFLAANPHRLDVGYGSWGGGGTGQCAVSREAIQLCLSHASAHDRSQLERTIIGYALPDASDDPEFNDAAWKQRLLLEAFGEHNLSVEGLAILSSLRNAFPEQNIEIPKRQDLLMSSVVSPISAEQLKEYTDEQLLAAMKQYNYGWDDRSSQLFRGSAVELSRVLQVLVPSDRVRFASLVHKMDDAIRAEYFEAILDGICNRFSMPAEERAASEEDFARMDVETILAVIRRLHCLPARPCGRSICHALSSISPRTLPTADLKILSYYALEDSDPKEDLWLEYDRKHDSNADTERAHQFGYNTVRGMAARTIMSLLFADYSRSIILLPIIESMTLDPSLAVRTCVFESLLPVLNHDRQKAVELFIQACENADAVLSSYPFATFVRYAASTHYAELRPVLQLALESEAPATATAAARQICLAAFDNEPAEQDASHVRTGSDAMRMGAAEVYSYNLGTDSVSKICATHLATLFNDTSKEVRDLAANCFLRLDDADFQECADLVRAYVESPAFPSQHDDLLRQLDESTWQLPDVTLRLAERFLEACGKEASDVSTAAAGDAPVVAKLVIRLYNQTSDEAIRSKCLDLIDEMEQLNLYGIDAQLAANDR
jgi:hypothetical protein